MRLLAPDETPVPLFTASNMSKWWAREAVGTIEDRNCLLGAAVFALDGRDEYPVTAPPDPGTHVLSIHLAGALDNVFSADKHVRFEGSHRDGDVILVPAGQQPLALLRNARSAEIMHLYVPDSLVRLCVEDMPGTPRLIEIKDHVARQDPEALRAAKIVRAEMRSPGLASSLLLDSIAVAMAVRLVRRWSNRAQPEPAESPRSGGLAPWQLKRVKEILRERLAEDVRLEELAQAVGLSTFHFARAFKKSTGTAPARFQTLQRLDSARQLMARQGLGVLDAAVAVGYDSGQAFARAFRREYGCSPTEFQRDHFTGRVIERKVS